MKKALILIGILVAANILFAQEPENTDNDLEKRDLERREEVFRERIRTKIQARIEEQKTRLELTEKQEEELKQLREKYRPEIESLKEDDSKSRSEKLRAMADLEENREKELSKILSEAQLAELKNIRKEVRENIRKRKKARLKRRSKN